MNVVEGSLYIAIHPGAGRIEIRSNRPAAASRVFVGRPAGEALDLLPKLYSLCGAAHACTGVRACEQAAGLQAPAAVESLRTALVDMETAREHLWRMLLDWPGFLDEQPDRRAMAEVTALHQTFRRALCPANDLFRLGAGTDRTNTMAAPAVLTKLGRVLEQAVFAMPAEVWITLGDEEELMEWAAEAQTVPARLVRRVVESGWAGLGRSPIAALPELPTEQLWVRLREPGFTAMPDWLSLPQETGPLARQARRPLIRDLAARHGNGLVTRLAARLLELALLPSRIARPLAPGASAQTCVPGQGLAQVEAARGRLVHAVELAEGVVTDYRILAPTEWNFHPEGAAVRGLAALNGRDPATLQRQAALLIDAVDPCVGYRLEIL